MNFVIDSLLAVGGLPHVTRHLSLDGEATSAIHSDEALTDAYASEF